MLDPQKSTFLSPKGLASCKDSHQTAWPDSLVPFQSLYIQSPSWFLVTLLHLAGLRPYLPRKVTLKPGGSLGSLQKNLIAEYPVQFFPPQGEAWGFAYSLRAEPGGGP